MDACFLLVEHGRCHVGVADKRLTEPGHSLQPVIGAMKTWGASYKENRTHEASRS
ncbi:hypothetical protein [uncultured Corynebacterium sp.]|uniref:hypothetical protein n=1 Tax=uncultured Corynebacterium sp. TaxID=159447 RepID=UPI00261248AC|nr:hypothetical protein [uncultured Corynebacterium sp.]